MVELCLLGIALGHQALALCFDGIAIGEGLSLRLVELACEGIQFVCQRLDIAFGKFDGLFIPCAHLSSMAFDGLIKLLVASWRHRQQLFIGHTFHLLSPAILKSKFGLADDILLEVLLCISVNADHGQIF